MNDSKLSQHPKELQKDYCKAYELRLFKNADARMAAKRT